VLKAVQLAKETAIRQATKKAPSSGKEVLATLGVASSGESVNVTEVSRNILRELA